MYRPRLPPRSAGTIFFFSFNFYHYFKQFRPGASFKILFELFFNHPFIKKLFRIVSKKRPRVRSPVRVVLLSPSPTQVYIRRGGKSSHAFRGYRFMVNVWEDSPLLQHTRQRYCLLFFSWSFVKRKIQRRGRLIHTASNMWALLNPQNFLIKVKNLIYGNLYFEKRQFTN